MGVWQIQEAKSQFSQVINKAVDEEPQEITKNGKTVAYIISSTDYEQRKKPSLKDVLKNCPHGNLDFVLERNQDNIRDMDL